MSFVRPLADEAATAGLSAARLDPQLRRDGVAEPKRARMRNTHLPLGRAGRGARVEHHALDARHDAARRQYCVVAALRSIQLRELPWRRRVCKIDVHEV